ncbi:hypothetical protein N8T08_001985 [Aspergillus melleus]|uniref:Uncharacterized protein n=1 Tax=Aspergillus melleus TaxID=138277 RepID=A0ACC3BAE0_9EURO|nr:hypothetical protein N8T08_001985 [Aspergillus melleus]
MTVLGFVQRATTQCSLLLCATLFVFGCGAAMAMPAMMTEISKAVEAVEAHHPGPVPTTCTTIVGSELAHIEDALTLDSLAGKGKYTRLWEGWLEQFMVPGQGRALLVSSGISALKMAACSQTFGRETSSSYSDLDDATMNMDAGLIQAAITPKMRVIVPVACNMDAIMAIARRHQLIVCEDVAMAFQEKENFTAAGQGGALLINNPALIARAETIYNQGHRPRPVLRGEVDRHQWLDLGFNATLSEVQAAFLFAQLQAVETINGRRRQIWQECHTRLAPLVDKGHLSLPHVPAGTTHKANVLYVRLADASQRPATIEHLREAKVHAHAQFMPLHSSPYGRAQGRLSGAGRVTTLASAQLLLLPVHLSLSDEELGVVVRAVFAFWGEDASDGLC